MRFHSFSRTASKSKTLHRRTRRKYNHGRTVNKPGRNLLFLREKKSRPAKRISTGSLQRQHTQSSQERDQHSRGDDGRRVPRSKKTHRYPALQRMQRYARFLAEDIRHGRSFRRRDRGDLGADLLLGAWNDLVDDRVHLDLCRDGRPFDREKNHAAQRCKAGDENFL